MFFIKLHHLHLIFECLDHFSYVFVIFMKVGDLAHQKKHLFKTLLKCNFGVTTFTFQVGKLIKLKLNFKIQCDNIAMLFI